MLPVTPRGTDLAIVRSTGTLDYSSTNTLDQPRNALRQHSQHRRVETPLTPSATIACTTRASPLSVAPPRRRGRRSDRRNRRLHRHAPLRRHRRPRSPKPTPTSSSRRSPPASTGRARTQVRRRPRFDSPSPRSSRRASSTTRRSGRSRPSPTMRLLYVSGTTARRALPPRDATRRSTPARHARRHAPHHRPRAARPLGLPLGHERRSRARQHLRREGEPSHIGALARARGTRPSASCATTIAPRFRAPRRRSATASSIDSLRVTPGRAGDDERRAHAGLPSGAHAAGVSRARRISRQIPRPREVPLRARRPRGRAAVRRRRDATAR